MNTADIIAGIDMAEERLVQRDCFSERTLRLLDELRAEFRNDGAPGEVAFAKWSEDFDLCEDDSPTHHLIFGEET